MNYFSKIVFLLAIFVLCFLAWPDSAVKHTYNCSNTSSEFIARGGECPLSSQADYTDLKFAGGWRLAQNSFCINDGKVMLFSSICQSNDIYESRSLRYAFLGSALITAGVGLILFRKPIISKLKKHTS